MKRDLNLGRGQLKGYCNSPGMKWNESLDQHRSRVSGEKEMYTRNVVKVKMTRLDNRLNMWG